MKRRDDLAPETRFRAIEIAAKIMPPGTGIDDLIECADKIVERIFPEPAPIQRDQFQKYNTTAVGGWTA